MAVDIRFMTVLHLCSVLVFLYSLSMFPPILVGLLYQDGELSSFWIAFALGSSVGALGWLATRRYRETPRSRDGFLVAVLFWLIFSALSALPFVLEDRLNISFVDAVFEGVSGITTTGATVLDDIDNLPHSLLYFRAQLNFLGGLGIIVLAIAIFPLLGIGGAKLYQSETPGPMKEEKLTPRLADTAKNLWSIYLGLAVACTVSFRLTGMGWFDAICHGLSTVSLGGFSTHGASLGFYNSPGIELVAGLFSLLAAVNFALYFKAFERRNLMPILQSAEFRFFLLMVAVIVSVACAQLYLSGAYPLFEAIVHGFFQSVSVMTDNGLAAANYPAWPPQIVLLLILASFFGGCVGSTCGGIKAMRFLLLYRQSVREILHLIHPRAILAVKVDQRPVADRVIQAVWGFFFLYLVSTIFFVIGLVFTGVDMVTAFGTVAACINNMGIGYGETATTFGTLNDSAKWLMCLAMLFGRLEIFPILILLSRAFWRF